ncbi:PREDICTED: uncharacterized protein LOC104809844 [Tarenaya hassleriana]|uniref:uncharacterized protein LOC104809844 n=1 Tax=Tarenaya hassleriana TaxID=28532 RepID=UPI00053C830C|nr:PREDICTED: uncharacterized protein LOC104809844 [Tarenaya hassleriana]
MWKKGELVWANINYRDSWIPARIEDPSESFGVLVSLLGLKEPRYFPAPFLRRFEHDFGTRILSSSGLRRRIVNRALRAHFWSVSYGLWCPCQPPITSPYLDRESSILWSSLSSEMALGFVREIAISFSVPLEGLADANRSTAQILSFRRYTVDFEQSEALHEEIRSSAERERMGHPEESESCPDPSNEEDDCLGVDPVCSKTAGSGSGTGNHKYLSGGRYHPSHEGQLVVDEICSWNLRNPRANSGSSISVKPCKSLRPLAKQDIATTTHVDQTGNHGNVKSDKTKRKESLKSTSADRFKKQKKASFDKPLKNQQTSKAMRIADPRCLRMKFLGNREDIPSEASLVKRFSVFGKIDASKTYVDKCRRIGKVAFFRSIDAVMAYKYARSEKISFGQSKVVYRFDLFEHSSERDAVNAAQDEGPPLKPCLKTPGSVDEEARRKLKMED